MALLEFSNKGIYCPKADVYIDPWKPVDKALITHGHSDHSRWGHKHYLCTHAALPAIRHRLGAQMQLQGINYGEAVELNGVRFSFHPAGHIIGSAQIRVEYKGEVWVVSGDYKTEDDGLCTPYEVVPCHSFITECTFGLPVYKWKPQATVFEDINRWWQQNKEEGKVSLLTCYSLGKAQRILSGLNTSIGQIYTHGAIEKTNEVIRGQGFDLPTTTHLTNAVPAKELIGQMILAPPSVVGSTWIRRFKPISIGIASGWMTLRGARRRRAVDRGFVLSDHADWDGLNEAIKATGAERIYVTHGYTSIFKKWLQESGYWAEEVSTEYEGELSEINESSSEDNEQEKE
jgi:putative mRNA 3-end processing factor